MTTLTQKKVKFDWLEACVGGFKDLKNKLTSAMVLTLTGGNQRVCCVLCPFSCRLGCFLMQHGKVITYDSRQLKVHEKNYANHDLQLATLEFVLKILRHYIRGVHIDLLINHKSL